MVTEPWKHNTMERKIADVPESVVSLEFSGLPYRFYFVVSSEARDIPRRDPDIVK